MLFPVAEKANIFFLFWSTEKGLSKIIYLSNRIGFFQNRKGGKSPLSNEYNISQTGKTNVSTNVF